MIVEFFGSKYNSGKAIPVIIGFTCFASTLQMKTHQVT